MFILTKVRDLVQIAPHDFSKKSLTAIEDNINHKYANKVVQKIGLCICLYDLLWASEGLIGHGSGLVYVNVEFRLVVFRPFKGEVMLGRIDISSPAGIQLKTDFFNDIFVPCDELPEGATYDINQQLWVWNADDQQMYYDKHDIVRFRVIDEEWHDQTPTKPKAIETGEVVEIEEAELRNPPYRIRGSMVEEGLGMCIWWDD